MLQALVSTSLKLRGVVIVLALLLLIVGVRTLPATQLDVFPEFAPPLVEIQTEAPGLSTTEVESLVTVPLENAMNGLNSLKTLRSKSVLGLSSVILIFQPNADLMVARQLVQERLTLAAARASRQKRFRAVSSLASDDMVLSATVRLSRSSRAA